MTIKQHKWITAIVAAASGLMLNAGAFAGETEDALIAKVVDAYGGAKLTNMKSIRIQDRYKTAFPGQGYTPGYVEFTELRQDAQLDLANMRGSVEAWSDNWNFTFNARTVSVDDGDDEGDEADIVAINYLSGNYRPAAFTDFYAAYGAVIRVTDTLLAYELNKQAESAEHKGEKIYIGRPHELLTFEMPSSPPVTLYIDAETGLITKMARETPFGALTYQFGNHTSASGVGYASSFEFIIGDDVNLLTLSRDVSVNSVRPAAFRIDRGITQEGERIDTSEMTVDEIADNVHLAGIGAAGAAAAYTAFIDAGDHVIAVGGYAGLQARYDAYKEAADHEKPLRYLIATHHHTDHLGGMADALALGAIFVSPANAVENLKTAAGAEIPEDRLMALDGKMTLGPVEIHDVWTNHMASMALVYIPSAKAVFQADHYTGNYVDGPSPAGKGAVMLKQAIDDLGLDVDTVLSAHGRKAVTWAEFETAVEAYEPVSCPAGRQICR